jgi:hypothetical protein
VIVCAPIGSKLVVKPAEPEARVTVPRDVVPDENTMLPVGIPAPELGATFAVRTSAFPNVGALGDTDRAVVVVMSAGGGLLPPQPIAKKTELNAIIVRARNRCRRRRGSTSSRSPARLPVAPAPSHPRCDPRTLAARLGPTNSGVASCSVSVELTAPWLLSTGALKEHAIPAGIVEGHEKEIDPAVNTVEPVGVAVTTTLPDALGASDNEAGLIVVVKLPDSVTIKGEMLAET